MPSGAWINMPHAPTVVIDVGHGGTDLGARNHQPYCEEKKLCLSTARLVRKHLEQLGYHVVMTRQTDSFIPLPQRVEIAKQAQGNIFVSIHYNSSRNQEPEGVEVFFYESSENQNRTFASKKLANSILTSVIQKTMATSRGVKKGNFHVIRETKMPAVLVEGGFISNEKERALLKTHNYQDKIARGIADGVHHYFKTRWKLATTKK